MECKSAKPLTFVAYNSNESQKAIFKAKSNDHKKLNDK